MFVRSISDAVRLRPGVVAVGSTRAWLLSSPPPTPPAYRASFVLRDPPLVERPTTLGSSTTAGIRRIPRGGPRFLLRLPRGKLDDADLIGCGILWAKSTRIGTVNRSTGF